MTIFVLILGLAMQALAADGGTVKKRPATMTMTATAHSQEGETADGSIARRGSVAGDPRILPLGTRIRVSGAGPYSGDYVVNDTGRLINGREIDIYMGTAKEARLFGKKRVRVTVLEWGEKASEGTADRRRERPKARPQ